MIDIWRLLNTETRRYSWRENTRKGIVKSHLDYWFIPLGIVYDVKMCDIHNLIYSDHNPITIEINISNRDTPGQGFWKLNTNLLTEKECNEKYKYHTNIGIVWNTVKLKLEG